MRYALSMTLYSVAVGEVELPDDKNWDDIKDWYVKWDTFHFLLKGESEYRARELRSDLTDGTDWKRPTSISVYPVEDDEIVWDVEVESR